jgi:type II secretion system protein G
MLPRQRAAKFHVRKGFTLIELLVVVVIIGILASVALPSFVGAQDKARNASVQSNARTVQIALEAYATENKGAYPPVAAGAWATAKFTGAGSTYFPGGKMPRSPWAAGTLLQSENVPLSTGKNKGKGKKKGLTSLADSVLNDPPEDFTGVNEDVGIGKIPVSFAGADEYGAVIYDYDVPTAFYLVYAMGKKGKESIVVSAKSNVQ